MPRVSVLMAVYNNEATLDDAVASVQSQTYADWEFIICDDASTDSSFERLSRYAQEDPRISVIRNDRNRGLAYSLNRCLEAACGEYLARQDGDDRSLPERFRRQVDFLEEHPEYAFVGCNIILFNEEGVWGERAFKPAPEQRDFFNRPEFCHPALIFRRNSLLAVDGYRVAKETRRGQDADLYMRMYAAGMRGYNLQEKLFEYYEGKLSIARIPMRHRWNSVVIRYKGYKAMGLIPEGLPFLLKPLVVRMIPRPLLRLYKRVSGSGSAVKNRPPESGGDA
jgi:glycosyltransferase involved in cell wall biosynthesis